MTDRRAPVVLTLAANTRTSWKIVLQTGVRLQKVILVSPVDQSVSGLPDATVIDVHSDETPSCRPCFWASGPVSRDADKKAPGIAIKRTGLEVSSYLEAKHGQEVLISEDVVSRD